MTNFRRSSRLQTSCRLKYVEFLYFLIGWSYLSHSWGWQQQVEVEKLIGRVPVEIRPPHEAAEQSGVQVGQVQVCSDSGRGEPATKIFFDSSYSVGVD